MGNLDLYNKLKVVPNEAIKPIQNGRLKGKSDINPMWRIRTMTEHFGVCGVGWKYVITKQWTETYGTETKAYCNIDLFVKVDGQWSDAIQGTGGSSEVTMERNGSYVSDECYKMALTDALSVAMKALGVGADIYFKKGKQTMDYSSKYDMQENLTKTQQQETKTQYHPNDLNEGMEYLSRCINKDNLIWVVQHYKPLTANPQFMQAVSAKKKQLGIQ